MTEFRRCKNCGQPYIYEYNPDRSGYAYLSEELKKAGVIAAANSKHPFRTPGCPICGSKDTYKYYRFFSASVRKPLEHFHSEDEFLDEDIRKDMIDLHYREDDELITPEYNKYIEECKKNVKPSIPTNIDRDTIDVTKYLEELLKIKTNEYALEERLREVLHLQYSSKQNSLNTKLKLEKYGSSILKNKCDEINDAINKIVDKDSFRITDDWYVEQKIDKPLEPNKPEEFKAIEPQEPIYKKPGLFNKKSVFAENEALEAKYKACHIEWEQQKAKHEAALTKYENDIEEYKKNSELFKKEEETYIKKSFLKYINDLATGNDELKRLLEEKNMYEQKLSDPDAYIRDQIKNSPAAIYSDLIEHELHDCLSSLSNAYQTEYNFLLPNILFPKYATLPAVSTICEYFITGRCSELAGANGAYNLYESEIRADRVIAQLDSISEKMDQIKANQYMLFNAIQSVSNQLSTLNETANAIANELQAANVTLNDIRSSSAVTAYNTAATAYYSRVNMELTNSLGYLIAMK